MKAPTAVICLSPYRGGMELDAVKIARMISADTPVHMIAQAGKFIADSKTQYEGYNGIRLHTLAFGGSLSPAIVFGVRRILKAHEIKNVFFFGASELKSLFFALLGLDINLIIRHGTTKHRPKKSWFHRLIYSGVHTHVAICEHLAANVRHIIPFGKHTEMKVIYPSLSTLPQQPVMFGEKPHQPVRLLHVGRIADGKGQKAAVNACAVLFENSIPFTLTLVGAADGSYEQSFMDFLDDVPYKGQILQAGFQSDVAPFYDESDLFLFPSDGEGLSNAFIEALAYGLVCISYDNTSFPELKNLGFDFFLVPDQDTKQLRSTLLSAVEHYRSVPENVSLAASAFASDRERTELLALLR